MAAISLVIPSWNDAAMLRNCLAALALQTRRPDDVIVVDNGSDDDTALVARAAGARVVVEPRRGVWPATIAGFDAAGGQILARLDADSVPPPDWLARVEAAIAEPEGACAVTGPGDFYGGTRLTRWIGEHVYIAGYFWFVGWLLGHPPLFGSNFAVTASVWKDIRPSLDPTTRRTHDDLQISFQLPDEVAVVYDPALRVGVSARPFSSLPGLGRRLGWAGLNLWTNRHRMHPGARRGRSRRERSGTARGDRG